MDAVQHKEVEVLEAEEIEENPAPQALQPFQDATNQLSNVAEDLERVAKDVFTGEKSLLALLSSAPKVRQVILDLEKNHPELLQIDEVSFRAKHREEITIITQRVRIALWQEFESAHLNNRTIRSKQLYAGVCSENTFYALINNPIRLAFILTAPSDYVVTLKEAHDAGLNKLRELFQARVVDEEGYMNPKVAEILIKAFAILDSRLKGAVVQRVDQRVLTANVPPTGVAAIGLPKDMEKLEEEIAKARHQLARITRAVKQPITADELDAQTKDIVLENMTTGDLAARAKRLGGGE